MDLDDDQFKEKIDQFKNDQSFNDEELNSFIQRVDKVGEFNRTFIKNLFILNYCG